jgi:hypothetical protein
LYVCCVAGHQPRGISKGTVFLVFADKATSQRAMNHPLGSIPFSLRFRFRRRLAAAMINPRVGIARALQ